MTRVQVTSSEITLERVLQCLLQSLTAGALNEVATPPTPVGTCNLFLYRDNERSPTNLAVFRAGFCGNALGSLPGKHILRAGARLQMRSNPRVLTRHRSSS